MVVFKRPMRSLMLVMSQNIVLNIPWRFRNNEASQELYMGF